MSGLIRPMPRVWADFTSVDALDQVWVALDQPDLAVDCLGPGDDLELFDFEGNACLAFIVELEGVGATCQLVVRTWTYTPEPDLPKKMPSAASYVQLDSQLELIG